VQLQKLTRLRGELSLWVQDAAAQGGGPAGLQADSDAALTKLKSMRIEVGELLTELGQQLAVQRDSAMSRVLAVVSSLASDSGYEQSARVWKDWSLGDITADALAGLSSEDLQALEQNLSSIMSQHIAEARAGELASVASEMAAVWDPFRLAELVEAIAREKRDVETVLTLAAARVVYPWEGTQSFPKEAVDSFLRGLSQIAGPLGITGLLNANMSTLLQSWSADDDVAQAKLFLYLLAAKYAGTYKLPGELLFGIATDWPLKGTPGWTSLWELALYDSPLPSIVEEERGDTLEALHEAAARVDDMFTRDGYKLRGLRSIQSARHLQMLSQELVPIFEKWWTELRNVERNLASIHEAYEYPRLQKQLSQKVDAMTSALEPASVEELYEHARYKVGVDDFQPFHRRVSLRALAAYQEALHDYAQALEAYLADKSSSTTVLTSVSLLAELTAYPSLQPIGQEVITQLRQPVGADKPEWDPEAASQDLTRRVLGILLSQATYARRLPRTVGALASSDFQWESLLKPLLADLADPLDVEAAARELVESNAPNQALLLAQQISLKQQKQAQSVRARLESEYVRFQRELLAVEASFDDLDSDRLLGRWPYVIRIMTERLQASRTKKVAEAEKAQRQLRELMGKVNRMEMQILEAQDELPGATREQVLRVIDLCRQAVRQSLLLGEVEEQLREFEFRLSHQSWPHQEIRDRAERLQAALKGEQRPLSGLPNVEGARDLLKNGDSAALGLTEAMMASISVAARCDLLDDWLEMRDLTWAPGRTANLGQRQKIRRLYASFGQMMAMAQVKSPTGEPVVYEGEIVAAHWALRYPKVAALKNNCVLIALPGNPPSPQYLKALTEAIDDREWLTYAFVLVFAPGIAPEQRQRLQQTYAGRRFVLIDEPVLLDMALAERRMRLPLGVLRPLMLNSLGADRVDVFEINQAVNAEMGIFVGRDRLIERIVSSGSNYALYGGRRIGKSSILRDVEDRVERQGVIVVSVSFEGEEDFSDDAAARLLRDSSVLTALLEPVETVGDLKSALQTYMDQHPTSEFLFTLDEIDRYIKANSERHLLIEALRSLSEQFGNRFRIVVAGFMDLYDCLQGRGPYSPSSDPWQRMLNDPGPLGNLQAVHAEMIVREGFLNILGWDFANRTIPRWIVERTGGHPAFVQDYCLKLQDLVARRGDQLVTLSDVEAIFADDDPDASFISYVRKTLNMNLEIGSIDGLVAQYVILYLSAQSSQTQGFTLDEAREVAASAEVAISQETLSRALERLKVTSVVQERSAGVYEFTVPDYPGILHRLGDTAHLEWLEHALETQLRGPN